MFEICSGRIRIKELSFKPIPAVILAALSFAALAFAGVPQTINYQGYLTFKGSPATGATGMTFSLYSSNPSHNNPVWRESKSVTPATVHNLARFCQPDGGADRGGQGVGNQKGFRDRRPESGPQSS